MPTHSHPLKSEVVFESRTDIITLWLCRNITTEHSSFRSINIFGFVLPHRLTLIYNCNVASRSDSLFLFREKKFIAIGNRNSSPRIVY